MKLALFILITAIAAFGQASGNVTMALFPGIPTGSCASRQLGLNQATGSLYTCSQGSWQMVSGGGGLGGTVTSFSAGNASPFFTTSVANSTTTPALSFQPYTAPNNTMLGNTSGTSAVPTWIPIPSGSTGTVTNFSSGNLSPLFTTSVATASTTPALSFTLSNAPANTMLGNSSSSSAPPSWIAIPSGGGGTNPLNGCQTATAGNLTCDNSMAVTTGMPGVLGLGYSSAGLPAPPSTAKAELAPDAQGKPSWSAGNNAPFEALATSSDVSTAISNATSGLLSSSAFPNCNMMGWSTQTSSATCADLRAEPISQDNYTLTSGDINNVIQYAANGQIHLPPPTGSLAAPFVFWVDTMCRSNVTLEADTGASINGLPNAYLGACGWAYIWADVNGATWHTLAYHPPGGVTVVE